MKLITPPLVIDEKDSFANDVLDRKTYGETLRNLVVNSDDALVISLDGKWGEGKTTFVKMWQGLLKEDKIPNVYIDAFANDYVDDAFISVASAITSYAEKNIKNQQNTLDDFKNNAKEVGTKLLPWAARVGIKAVTLGIIEETNIKELKNIQEDLSNTASDLVASLVDERLNSHTQDIEQIESFKKVLSELPSKLQQEGSDKPLVIIIDELDRCRPTFAVEMVEKIKHLFSVENVVFLLVMNKKQLEESIRCVYGKIDAHTYLQKFINLEMKLPKKIKGIHTNDIRKYIERLYEVHELETWGDKDGLIYLLEIFAKHFNLSLRQLEKTFTQIAVFYSSSNQNEFRLIPVIVFLSILKVFNPNMFDDLLQQKITFDFIWKELQLNHCTDDLDWPLQEIIKYVLLTEDEFNSLDVNDELKEYRRYLGTHNIQRKNILPFFVRKLNAFSISG